MKINGILETAAKTFDRLMLAAMATLAVAFYPGGVLADGPVMSQDLVLKNGWNLFTLKVTPEKTASEFFAGWPLARAGEYDGDAVLETKQYSAFLSTEGALANAWRVYVPGNPDVTTLKDLSANKTYLVKLTNAYSTVVWGTPVAARNALHATSSNVLNYAQVTLQSQADKVILADYFNGLNAGKWSAYDLYGTGDAPQAFLLTAQSEITGDKTIAVTCERVSDWSGPLYVSPREGIDFGDVSTLAALSVRNDTTKERAFRLSLQRAHTNEVQYGTFVTNYWLREAAVVGSNVNWRSFSMSEPFERTLAAGETVELNLGFDRTAWTHLAEATPVAGLLCIDELGTTRFRTTVPIQATVGGMAAQTNCWPNGLWLVEGELNAVSYVKNDIEISPPLPARGKMPVRLILERMPDGEMLLLPQVSDGSVRLTSSVLPLDLPNVKPLGESAETAFGSYAAFKWHVSETSTLNPFYHARHPDHDGLSADYKSRVPSGDNADNYLNDVKPELFSIDNTVELRWDESSGTAWCPEETMSGTLTWRFGGLRRQGELSASGTFTMRRLSAFQPK